MAKKKQTAPVGVEEIMALYGADQDKNEPRRGIPRAKAGPRRRGGGVPRSRGLRRLTRVLGGIACGLVLVILGGTLYAVFRDSGGGPPDTPTPEASGGDDVPAAGVYSGGGGLEGQDPAGGVFTGLGRLRISAGPPAGANSASRTVVVLSVVFPYPPGDKPFTEELAGKVPLFRRIIRDYFGALSGDELNPLDEQKAKAELLRRFNAELRLGKIESLLFNELMILE